MLHVSHIPIILYSLPFWSTIMKKFLVIALFAAGSMTALADHTPLTPRDADYDANHSCSIKVGVYQPTTVMCVYEPDQADPNQRFWFNSDQVKPFEFGFEIAGAAARLFDIKSTITVDPDELSTSYAAPGTYFMTVGGVVLDRDANTPVGSATYGGVTLWANTTGATAGGNNPAYGPKAYEEVTNGSVPLHMGWPEIYPGAPFSLSEYETANDPTKRFVRVQFNATAGIHGTSGKGTIICRLDVIDIGAII
jgi:hypothetical protein